jgi:peptidyl-prolyl cis-trans isomerase D
MRSGGKWFMVAMAAIFVAIFVFGESSGLLGRGPVTTSTVVAKVNGEEILATDWFRAVDQRAQQEQQRAGRPLTLDERRQLEQAVFDELVTGVLVRQEIDRRGIRVTDQEIQRLAQVAPPPELAENPELQTDGRFDPDKYRRFLTSPTARSQGILQYLERYYRSEVPRQKLLSQVASEAYASDARLWQAWQDQNDSAQVSYVALRPDQVPDSAVAVTDSELRAFFDKNAKTFERPGRAVVSLVSIPRVVTAEDTAAARTRAAALRAEIAGGAKFEEVAQRESADSGSAQQGGDLGRGGRGRFVAPFEQAAYALAPGQLSEPVQSPFGFHIIRVDTRQGDTLGLRHILVPIQQSDSSAARTDRRADSLANAAASTDDPRKFDAAVARFGLPVRRLTAFENEPLSFAGRPVPSVSAWAFSGVGTGETSELYDAPDAYYLARLDSLTVGGKPPFEAVKDEVRERVLREKKLQQLVPRARQLAEAARTSTLESAAAARQLTVERTPAFTRSSLVPGLGQFTEAVGAAFGVPQGQISAPVVSRDGVYLLRVDRRVAADKGRWLAQKEQQRAQVTQALRQTRVRDYLADLRESAKIDDRRKEVLAAQRRSANG